MTGPLLLYPNETVQHAGMFLRSGLSLRYHGIAGHTLRLAHLPKGDYLFMTQAPREVDCLTGAALVTDRQLFDDLNGFDPLLGVLGQDVDLCLELRSQGLRNIFTPRARFYHLESRSRGRYYDLVDRNLLLDRWSGVIAADPYFNPNFDVEACDYSLKPEPLLRP